MLRSMRPPKPDSTSDFPHSRKLDYPRFLVYGYTLHEPSGRTTGDSPRTFRYEFDGTGRVTSAYVEEWELHYEIFYGEQEMQEYPKPVL